MAAPESPVRGSPGRLVVRKLPEDVPRPVFKVFSNIRSFLLSTRPQELDRVLVMWDEHASLDTHLFHAQGKNWVRAVSCFAGFLSGLLVSKSDVDFKVAALHSDEDEAGVDTDVVLHLEPRPPWWLPVSWMLPAAIECTVQVRVKVATDNITSCKIRLHNLPELPMALRYPLGLALGSAVMLQQWTYTLVNDFLQEIGLRRHLLATEIVTGGRGKGADQVRKLT